ncbi:PPK2 family polyphosphate kinase [Zhihengliuella flava]|uniref:PPK2 family polyphosphate:nucleotide phosphotransferase n=1 Tax=Zhihengliuella flava TaxID=1285193 RepID=A0A931DBF2_9MICC|nr:PPK2 family polyphosphate kinase [Zhihengliuella flava]MBG6085498.1 PPK2 family polyphosphate:nucleotide phosphotransferase [Zhihengliuella flava]
MHDVYAAVNPVEPAAGIPAFETSPTTTLRARIPLRLAEIDPRGTAGYAGSKAESKETLAGMDPVLSDWQERLFAASRHGSAQRVLLIIQGMDTAGKGGIVRHVIGSVDPQGVHHAAFKAPTAEELAHDFLWRIEREVPQEGMLGVFDRSHYEDVLIARVRGLADHDEVQRRFAAIRDFEARLAEAGTAIVKVMLHISREEQAERLAARLDRPEKHWKFDPSDIDERAMWEDYQLAYQAAIEATDADHAPWFVVPADRKWFARISVQALLIDALQGLNPQWPAATFDVEAEKARLAASR